MQIALFQPDIAANVGAVSGWRAGCAAHVIEPCGFVWDDRRVRRVGLDYLRHARVERIASFAAFQQARGVGTVRLVLLTTRASRPYYAVAYRQDDILLVGRESVGVPDAVHAAADLRVRVPMAPGRRSPGGRPSPWSLARRCARPAGSPGTWRRRLVRRDDQASLFARALSETLERMIPDALMDLRERASAWFEALRDRLCAAFERLEAEYRGPECERLPAGRFMRQPWDRAEGGGGVMALMRGRVREGRGQRLDRLGRISSSLPDRSPAQEDPRFWASGISLVAHPRSPHVRPHMNTRHIQTMRAWFGGGADLNPIVPDEADTLAFHGRLERPARRSIRPTTRASSLGGRVLLPAASRRAPRRRWHLL